MGGGEWKVDGGSSRWVEVTGGEWRWVEVGARFSITRKYLKNKHLLILSARVVS